MIGVLSGMRRILSMYLNVLDNKIKEKIMDFVPNIEVAKNCVRLDKFSPYSPAYVITNEDLRQSMQFVPKNCNRALVTAASGDHPLFCSLYGARQVDTFDISYNAKCIMDIKTAALKCMGHVAYIELLKNLRLCQNIQHVPDMEYISKMIPKIEWEYMCSMAGSQIFSNGIVIKDDNTHLVNYKEYKKLQKIVKGRYNFIMSDIANLSGHLTGTYDFIHLSNILDYRHTISARLYTIFPLLKHVKVGGRIVCYNLVGLNWEDVHPIEHFEELVEDLNEKIKCFDKTDEWLLKERKHEIAKAEKMCDSDFENFDYTKIGDMVIFERLR